MRQRGIEGASAAAGCTRTHVVQNAVHGIALVDTPGETGQLPDRTCGEVTGDRGERSVQTGGEVKSPPVMAAEVPSGVWSTVTDQAPGKAPDAMPTKRPCADVAAYSSPLTESEDVVAAIAAAGLTNRAAAAAIGTIQPRHRMTYPLRARR